MVNAKLEAEVTRAREMQARDAYVDVALPIKGATTPMRVGFSEVEDDLRSGELEWETTLQTAGLCLHPQPGSKKRLELQLTWLGRTSAAARTKIAKALAAWCASPFKTGHGWKPNTVVEGPPLGPFKMKHYFLDEEKLLMFGAKGATALIAWPLLPAEAVDLMKIAPARRHERMLACIGDDVWRPKRTKAQRII